MRSSERRERGASLFRRRFFADAPNDRLFWFQQQRATARVAPAVARCLPRRGGEGFSFAGHGVFAGAAAASAQSSGLYWRRTSESVSETAPASMGLAMWAFIPAAIAAATSSLKAFAVRATIGIEASARFFSERISFVVS